MNDIIVEIDEYVKSKIKELNPSQIATLKALILAGYKGERDYVLKDLLKEIGEEDIAQSGLTETFEYSFENEKARYIRIKPEFFRAVRRYFYEKL
ncbi:MAG: hypothetical protein ACE5PM_05295 [Candidatus Hydrothermarchaeales archaeon]